ncbi:branched-chain amino acid ABC transporter substrate-binding protein [Verminephrobacter eiseniae]|uniref:branched-chain amino acid ABC transporter substrate-binding protein n=1 Tax=Verminephrobacter eiseniae TaxID=364317 RepID=UPI0022375E40|nr:branched-chain amino acid ABC transporter substrate-binding protein [Verminephrobacter eiseniae]MCW5262633.1 branched-chain amino acid ABC transporter substrate-binding protein [Verminephrobacter eiseniae]
MQTTLLARLAALAAPAALSFALSFSTPAGAQEPFKIAYIDPLTGPFASVGELMLTHTQYAVEDINAKGGVLKGQRLQLLLFDSRLSAQESQSALQAAIDQGARAIVTGGSGSSVVTALVQAAARHNQRNPGKEVIVLNHSSIDPDLTGKTCNFWHFQFEANTAMKMKAIANYMKKQPDISRVYLLNQDYAHGRQWAHYGREMVGLARPDIQFVGETMHPLGRVKDFAPYLARVKSSAADTVITGNWGQDLVLLLKAAGDAGYHLRYFNHSAGAMPGTVLAVSQARLGQLTWVAEWHPGQAETPRVDALARAYKAKTGKDFLAPRIEMTPRFLAAAIDKAQSTDPLKIARALEDLTLDSVIGPVRMRGEDHQLLLPQVVNTIAPVDGKAVKAGWEGTNYGFRTDMAYTGNELAQGTQCKMARP